MQQKRIEFSFPLIFSGGRFVVAAANAAAPWFLNALSSRCSLRLGRFEMDFQLLPFLGYVLFGMAICLASRGRGRFWPWHFVPLIWMALPLDFFWLWGGKDTLQLRPTASGRGQEFSSFPLAAVSLTPSIGRYRSHSCSVRVGVNSRGS